MRTRSSSSARRPSVLSTLSRSRLRPGGLQGGLERGRLAPLEVAHRGVVDEVLAHRALEPEQVVHDRLGVVAEQLDLAGVPGDRPDGELVARGVGHHPGVGLVADAQAVLGEQRGGVGVVGGDGRLEDLLVGVGGRLPPAVPGRGQAVADASAELAGGLGREGEPEHLVGRDLAGDHEVDDAGGHQRGLAGAGTRDDDGGLERAPRWRSTAGGSRWKSVPITRWRSSGSAIVTGALVSTVMTAPSPHP